MFLEVTGVSMGCSLSGRWGGTCFEMKCAVWMKCVVLLLSSTLVRRRVEREYSTLYRLVRTIVLLFLTALSKGWMASHSSRGISRLAAIGPYRPRCYCWDCAGEGLHSAAWQPPSLCQSAQPASQTGRTRPCDWSLEYNNNLLRFTTWYRIHKTTYLSHKAY